MFSTRSLGLICTQFLYLTAAVETCAGPSILQGEYCNWKLDQVWVLCIIFSFNKFGENNQRLHPWLKL